MPDIHPSSRLPNRPSSLPIVGAHSPRLRVELAITPEQVNASFRLRHRVFVQELGAKIDHTVATGLEMDDFDAYCHHLVVRDLDAQTIVASTRILTDTQARVAGGFYSAKEFDLDAITHVQGRVMEIGRTCVHPDYRTGATIGTLWSGLAQFMEINRFAYLMGCASISMQDGGWQAQQIMTQMRGKYRMPDHLPIRSKRHLPPLNTQADIADDHKVPPLLKAYLRLGARMGDEAYWDEDFNTADVFIWLERSNLQQRYLRHFVERKAIPLTERYVGQFAA